MIDTKIFDEMAKNFTKVMPDAFKNMQSEFEKNMKVIMQNTFNRLDLVTREDFDTQVKVLEKTREKVDTLEKQLAKLIEQHKNPVAKQKKDTK